MTIGIVTVAHGRTYHEFLREWGRAVAALERKPDTITIVHDGVGDDIKQSLSDLGPIVWVHDTATRFTTHPQFLINTGIALTGTDWIVKLDADDLILPHALNTVDSCTADVLNFGYRIGDHDHVSTSPFVEQLLDKMTNPISSCSPFRRWVWEQNKFRDMVYDDWMFWIDAARSGATFDATGTVDYIYRIHPDQITARYDATAATNVVRSL